MSQTPSASPSLSVNRSSPVSAGPDETWTVVLQGGEAVVTGASSAQRFRFEGRSSDLLELLASNAELREVRTGVITEITADSAIVDRLPLWLTVPNPDVTEDPSAWPDDVWYRHVDSCLDDERAWFDGRDDRVLYVNGDRWTIGKDSQGHAHAFPVGKEGAENPLQQTWVDVFGSGAGLASSTIGALTPSVGAVRDYNDGIAIYYRLFALTEPAEHVASWLLSGEFVSEHRDVWQGSDEVAPDEGDLFLRLFINVVTGQSDGHGVPGSRLAPGEGMGISDLDLWTMTVDVPSDCRDAIMQRILADRRGRYSKDHPWILR